MFHTKASGPVPHGQGRGALRTLLGRVAVRRGALGVLAVLMLAVTVPATASAKPQPVQWAALGDSYTAGVFVGAPSPPLGSPDRDGCARTTGSYPYLVERGLAAHPPAGRAVRLTDVGCGNATVNEITVERQTPIDPVQEPPGGWPGVAPQVDRAHVRASTGVVTIGVGVNTLPIADMEEACLLLGTGRPDRATPCRDAYENGGPPLDHESIHAKYDRITRQYGAMLRAVRQRAPHAKIITVGYPTIFPADARGCDRHDPTELATRLVGGELVSMTHGDIAWLHGVITHVNAIIRSLTERYGDTYVDTATSSVGHDACRSRAAKWVQGFCGQAAPYWPKEISLVHVTMVCSGGNRATIVHPDAAGQADIAAQVEAAVRTALCPRRKSWGVAGGTGAGRCLRVGHP
ncbi:SGNH/GDSL hydrolase family protein [Streptomyces sp. NPDC004129]|uniref:SGNH/GDSL hydrolase family protein n=1 Tax=Streptomyces sp. NPDC004533 TaxID=3154278 RepID=UPI0033A487D5